MSARRLQSLFLLVILLAACMFSPASASRLFEDAAGPNVPEPLNVPVNGLRIDFQPTSYDTPAGFIPDDGSPFGTRGEGYHYGWDGDNRLNTVARNTTYSPDAAYDTLILMQNDRSYNWKIALPDGQYQVRLVAGDPAQPGGVFRIKAEGITVIDGVPTASSPWLEGVAVVMVSDGYLDVTNASGARDNKLCFLEIIPLALAQPDRPYHIHLPLLAR